MKNLLLALAAGLALSIQAAAGQATGHPATAPADTVVGEAHLRHLLTQGICERTVIESRHQDLTVLTRSQGTALLQEMLTAVLVRDSAEFRVFIAKAPDMMAALQRLTMQAMLGLPQECPAASKLLTQMGRQMSGVTTTFSDAQKRTLQVVAHATCERLTAANTARPLSQRTATERLAAYHQATARALETCYPQLQATFGDRALQDQAQYDKLWQYIDVLMFEQCPEYTGQLRIDRGLKAMREQAADSAALAPAPAVPMRRPPARRN